MKIGKVFKFILKTLTTAIAIGSIVYIVKDIMDKKASDNFDDTWDDDFDDDFNDMFDDEETENVVPNREYVKMDPTKMSADTCEE
nr:hypothetical protein [Frisingicoccus sp.]